MTSDFEYISDRDRLAAVVQTCLTKDAVAIDTEFARTSTYYPIVGLIQIFDGEHCYLIDPLDISDLSPLNALMTDESVVKIFHACSEDMEVFQHCLGVVPRPVFDTQIAAALLGAGFSMSYQKLVEHYTRIHVEKGETRSDWLQRPLTKSQLSYAALDVIHLNHVYEIQCEQLQSKNKVSWMKEECAGLAVDIPTQIDPDVFYLKLKNLWRLDRKQLAVLKNLSAWRERKARDEDQPRNRIVDEKSLYAIAQLKLADKEGLQNQTELRHRQLRKYGDEILAQIEQAESLATADLPAMNFKSTVAISSSDLKKLKEVAASQSELLSVSVEMLAKRRHLEQLLKSKEQFGQYTLPTGLSGWREQAIGEPLLKLLNK